LKSLPPLVFRLFAELDLVPAIHKSRRLPMIGVNKQGGTDPNQNLFGGTRFASYSTPRVAGRREEDWPRNFSGEKTNQEQAAGRG